MLLLLLVLRGKLLLDGYLVQGSLASLGERGASALAERLVLHVVAGSLLRRLCWLSCHATAATSFSHNHWRVRKLEGRLLIITASATTTGTSARGELATLCLTAAVARLGRAVPLASMTSLAAVPCATTGAIPRRGVVLPVSAVWMGDTSCAMLLSRAMVDIHLRACHREGIL